MYRNVNRAVLACFFLISSVMFNALPQIAQAQDPVASGTIVETADAAGYTYLLVKSGDSEKWVAIPETKVKVGDEVSYLEGMVMTNFTSKSLNKTFPSIIFSSGLLESEMTAAAEPANNTPEGDDSFAAALKAEQQGAQPGMVNPHKNTNMQMEVSGGSAGAITPQQDVNIEKAAGENSYSVSEVFAQAEQLNGQTVRVRGKVVKFSPSIMGRNWIHLQDGSGDPMQNTHDLVFTSQDKAEENSVITLEGTLAANKDFGAGYKYAAIVEKAAIVQ